MDGRSLSASFPERFWAKVEKTSGCWIWGGGQDSRGYGFMFDRRTRRTERAHRLAYELAFGPFERGLHVLHRCDNPPCVNPAHLFLGTRADNMRDARRKGRLVGNARLGKDAAVEIRQRYTGARGEQKLLAEEFGVSTATISRVLTGKVYGAAWKGLRVVTEQRRDSYERFWKKVICGEPDECWPWMGNHLPRGYGLVSINRRRLLAHRAAWEGAFGSIPEGLQVLHSCDNPPCVNPAHLFLGTQADNIRDAQSKGRLVGNITRHLRGEKAGGAKLTESQVLEIRRRYGGQRGEAPRLALEFGVSSSTVKAICSGRTWSHLPLADAA